MISAPEIRQIATHKVLWVVSSKDDYKVLVDELRQGPYEISCISIQDFDPESISKEKCASIFVDSRVGMQKLVGIFDDVSRVSASTARIAMVNEIDSHEFETLVNETEVFHVLPGPLSTTEVHKVIEKSIAYFVENEEKRELFQRYRDQNDKLEEMTEGLEQLVVERTLNEEQSKKQAEEKLSHVRSLVKFIKELALSNTIEDWIILLKKSFKGFSTVRSPILCYLSPVGKMNVVFFQGQQVVERKTSQNLEDRSRIVINDNQDRQLLANLFSRPFIKLVSIPITSTTNDSRSMPAILYIEHDLDETQVEVFLEFVSDRLQPLKISLDRILLDYQLRFTSYQWESTFDGLSDPIAIVNDQFELIRSNQQFDKNNGNKNCYVHFSNRSEKCVGCPVPEVLESREPKTGKVRRGDSYYEVHSYPIQLYDNELPTVVINHYVDTTQSIALRGKVIQNEKMAAVGLLAGNIAHELNNPLTGIRSLSQVLLSEVDDDQLKEDLKEIESASRRCQGIIDNLLSFSTPGKDAVRVQIDLSEVVTKTLPMLKTAMREHNCDVALSDEVLSVDIELHLFQQVVFNLVNNACQAMEEGGQLKIKTEADRGFAKLSIIDNGPGIPPSVLTQIFEPFFTTKEEGKGTGLGLSMSKSVVESFGGHIEVNSTAGEGTVFSVFLPLEK